VMKYPGKILWVYADDKVLEGRAHTRGDAATIQLSLDRMKNDKIAMFDVLYCLLEEGLEIIPIRSQDVDIWINRLIFKGV
jgi:hypothetical protein